MVARTAFLQRVARNRDLVFCWLLTSTFAAFVVNDGRLARPDLAYWLTANLSLCALLRAAGFSSFKGFETISRKPFQVGARRLSLVATK